MKSIVSIICAASLLMGVALAQTQDPPCYSDRPAPPYYRTEAAADGSTLRIVGVYVDSAIDTGDFSTGVDRAMANWNTTTAPDGTDLPYRFERVSDPAQAGVTIAGGGENCAYGCSCYNPNTRTIRTAATLRDNSVDDVAGIVAHELGHPMGLVNSTNLTSTSTSIMQYATGDCIPFTRLPQPNDVAQVNRHSTLRDTCTVTQPVLRNDDIDVDPGGGGGDGGQLEPGGGGGGGGGGYCTEWWWVWYECSTEEAKLPVKAYIQKAGYQHAVLKRTVILERECYETRREYAGCW